MALILKGNTSTGITTNALQTESNLRNLIITNKTGGAVTLNLNIGNGNINVSICPENVQLQNGQSYADQNILFQVGEFLIMTVTGSCDYYFDFEISAS